MSSFLFPSSTKLPPTTTTCNITLSVSKFSLEEAANKEMQFKVAKERFKNQDRKSVV